MADAKTNLTGSLTRLRRRARAVRNVRLTGRALLASAVVLLAVLVSRQFLRGHFGVEILPLSRLELILAAAAALLLAVAAASAVARFAGPDLLETARRLDRSQGAKDLFSSGLAAAGRPGPVAAEVLRRAGEVAGTLDPSTLFPARRSVARTLAILPLALACVYLLGLPPGEGLLPLGGRSPAPGGHRSGATGPAAAAVLPEPGAPPEESSPAAAPATEPAAEPAPEGKILARVVPAKEVYEPNDPVTIFVQAKPDRDLSRAHDLEVSLVVDGTEAPLSGTLTVGPAADAGAVATVLARYLPELASKLEPGKHRVSAVLREGDREFRTEEVEFEIRGDAGGGGAPKPKPKPEERPAAGSPPPPDVRVRPRFVTPLFGPGETREKEGYALVPDPKAPPGTPPRRVPLDEAAREAARRAESAVPVESTPPADRDFVRRYFDALREGR